MRLLSPQTYIEKLELGDVVDLILINPSRMVHPMHLHGGRSVSHTSLPIHLVPL